MKRKLVESSISEVGIQLGLIGKKVKCYSCGELGHFSIECAAKKTDDTTRYSAYRKKELEPGNSKAMVSVDSMVD